MDLFLLCLPWIAVGAFSALCIRIPPRLPPAPTDPWTEVPLVSVIVPARNEEVNLPPLLDSLAETEYPHFEVLVVDDGSEDRTREVVLGARPGNAERIQLIPGSPLPEGWFGKPWACHQGAGEARGEILLFTDADTVHDPLLLSRAVAGLVREDADVVTVIGHQVMGSFWERLLQPQFFAALAFRFPRAGTPPKPTRWRHAIANGQYLLFRRESYETLGGHQAVRGEVVDDMRLAQLLVAGGWRLLVREEPGLKTRMYRSLGGLVEGWSKNITIGALQASGGWIRPVILPLALLVGAVLWILPPVVLCWSLLWEVPSPAFEFGLVTWASGVLFWGTLTGVMRDNPLYGFLYPLGSLMAGYIFLLSWVRGGRVRWRGRTYAVSPELRRGRRGEGP